MSKAGTTAGENQKTEAQPSDMAPSPLEPLSSELLIGAMPVRRSGRPRADSRPVGLHQPSAQPKGWWSQTGSNRRPPACKAGALPTELWPRRQGQQRSEIRRVRTPTSACASLRSLCLSDLCPLKLVGLGRLERPTSPLSGVRSNHLSYRPLAWRWAQISSKRPPRAFWHATTRLSKKEKRRRRDLALSLSDRA